MDLNVNLLPTILRTDFKTFCIKVFNTISSADTYMDNWHVDVICNEIEQMIDGKNNRLIINIPPRNMKSIICSVALPAFLLGHDPTTRIICVSYGDELVKKLANDCKTVMTSAWYKELFPRTVIDSKHCSATDFGTTCSGGRFSTSVGGPLTGIGGDWIIIDDPLKAGDGSSDTIREKVNDWYTNTLYSRLNNKNTGRILVIMQRLHLLDFTGFLMSLDMGYKLIRIPMIAETDEDWSFPNKYTGKMCVIKRKKGDLLHTEREGPETVEGLRNAVGIQVFAGQYQQTPIPTEGGLVKSEWLCFYQDLPPNICHVFISWDTASKTGDGCAYSACCVFGLLLTRPGPKIYLMEVFRERLEYPRLHDKVLEMHKKYEDIAKEKFRYCNVMTLIEDASSGTQLIQQLGYEYKSTRVFGSPPFIGIKPDRDKVSRLESTTTLISNGTVLFPDVAGPWWPDFKKELLSFPGSIFKDQCDAFSQGVIYIDNQYISGKRGMF